MALAGELAKYIGNEIIKVGGKDLATKTAPSALSNLAPKIATKAGASMDNKIGKELIAGSVLDKLVPTNRMLDKSGRPITLYHSTPNNFDKFDDAMLGSNTGYDNTALGHFVTPDKDFSKRFIDIDNVGKTGRTMELQGNIRNPILHPYMAGYKYKDPALRDKIVENYFLATDNQEGLNTLRDMVAEDALEFGNDANLYNEYMALADDMGGGGPFEFAGDERELLKKKGYDAVEIVEGPKSGLVEGAKSNVPVSSYAVFNGENLRPVRHIPINQVPNTEEVPVSTLRNLFRGQLYSDTDFSYNSPSMNSGDSAGSQALGGAYHFTPDEGKANAWADNAGGGVIKIGYKPDQLLKAEDARRMIQEAADKLNDGAYMSKLWQTDPELAEQIELIGIGNLEALAKREGKPFVEHINANDNELGTIYYYKDVDEGLTEKFREQFRKTKAEKYLGKPKVQQSKAELSPQQQGLFKDSVLRDENEVREIGVFDTGKIKKPVRHIPIKQDNYSSLYHQTSAKNLADFSLDKRKSIGSDYGMPEGIFLKDTNADIGLPGKNQLKLDAKMNNPITFENRQELARYMEKRNPEYKALVKELDKINETYDDYLMNYMAERGMNPDDYFDFDSAMNDVDKYIEDKAREAREMISAQLKKDGYDGAIVNKDEGTRGRSVKSYVVLDKEQLRDNEIPVKIKKYLDNKK